MQNNIHWQDIPDNPQMFCPRQKMFYKLSVDKKRLYVFDDDCIWKLSKHKADDFFKYEEPIYSEQYQQELESITTSKLNKLWLWCKLESGRSKRLASFIGCSPTMITNICNGKKELPIQMIQKVTNMSENKIDFQYGSIDFQAQDLENEKIAYSQNVELEF